MPLRERRTAAVEQTIQRVRELEREHGVTRDGVAAIRGALQELAAQEALFPSSSFPAGGAGSQPARLFRLWEDPDRRFALYVNSSSGRIDSPPHNHTTWAVVVGMRGVELNRLYERTATGVKVVREVPVERGTGVALLPDDIHSIHIRGDEPVLNFHLYGRALEELHKREYFDSSDDTWKVFPPLREIHEPVD